MLKDWIQEQKKEHQQQVSVLDSLAVLNEKYPDLKRTTNRWNRVRFSSASVNNMVTDCDISHNCGCCPDSPLEVWPYLQDGKSKIYSDPPSFFVGESNAYGYGENPDPGWEEELKAAEINELVIEKVREYFDDNPPEYENDED